VYNERDAHSLTVASEEQVDMALLSGLQLSAYYMQPRASMHWRKDDMCLTHGGA